MSVTHSCIQPANGESINSFIFRLLLIHGCQDFSGVINYAGWRVNPFMPEDYRFLLRDIDILTLVNIYEMTHETDYLFAYKRSNLTSLSSFIKPFTLYETFFSRKKDGTHDKETHLIRYCSLCINDQISKTGFSYFKRDWNYAIYCNLHKINLHVLLNSDNKTAEVEIKRLYIGDFSSPNRFTTEKDFLKQKKEQSFDFRIAPCARLMIAMCALKNKRIKPNIDYYDGYEFLKPEEILFLYNYLLASSCEHSLSEIYDDLMLFDFDLFVGFLNRTCKITPALYKMNGAFIHDKYLLKVRKKSCSNCTTYSCPNNSEHVDTYLPEITHCLSCSIPENNDFYNTIDSFSRCLKCSDYHNKLKRKIHFNNRTMAKRESAQRM